MAKPDQTPISDYQKKRCQLQNVICDTGGSYRPFFKTRIKRMINRIPLLALCTRLLKHKLLVVKRSPQRPRDSNTSKALAANSLDLKSGEWVRVLSNNSIRATLNRKGCHMGTRFLHGMWKFCGKEFQVFKPIKEIVDYRTGEMWRVRRTVVLKGVHCEKDPSEYYRCDQTCFYYWKEAWLERCEAHRD